MKYKHPGPFIVEGYNKDDYISDIVNWELLFVAGSERKLAEQYVRGLPKSYIARITKSEVFSEDLNNKHWEIYTGV